ncbi:MAG: carbamoyl phosphate synthase small subunit [Culicoidibacterales bacterium]
MKNRVLILENGLVFYGTGFGSNKEQVGELVFNTGMTGYQEVLSDPSYCGQIVTMTYPLIGNYGINRDDFESLQPAVFGFVVREYCETPSNFRGTMTLNEYLQLKDIPGISGVDTRALTKVLRSSGTMKAIMCPADVNIDEKVAMLQNHQMFSNHVAQVSTQRPYAVPNRGKKVVMLDFGAKLGITRELSVRGCDIMVVPHDTPAKQILALNPDGVMLSNGPGDPKDAIQPIETIKQLLGQVPIFGICLGHQLLALACGADTQKLKFGHRGCNQPVKNLATNKVEITSQNHGYEVNEQSLQGTGLVVTHVALNDQSVEGIAHTQYPAFSVQYHPEAAPGPTDPNYLFDQFMTVMETKQPLVK